MRVPLSLSRSLSLSLHISRTAGVRSAESGGSAGTPQDTPAVVVTMNYQAAGTT